MKSLCGPSSAQDRDRTRYVQGRPQIENSYFVVQRLLTDPPSNSESIWVHTVRHRSSLIPFQFMHLIMRKHVWG